jgi:hypothetical protein
VHFIAIESVVDDDRSKDPFGSIMSINMLIKTGTGFDYSLAGFKKGATATGFKSVSLLPLAGLTSTAIAYK